MANAVGPDVSKWQVEFNPTNANGPVDFSFEKVTDGTNVHEAFETMWLGVSKTPIRGGYHYQRSGVNWQAQADKFLQAASTKDFHIYALDVEGAYNTVNTTFLLESRKIIDYWKTKTSKRVILYTNLEHYKQLRTALGADADVWLNSIPLWFAYPNGKPGTFIEIPGRTNWSLHQYSWTDQPERWGTQALTDANVFNGTVEDMKRWVGITTPPTGEPMIEDKYFKVTINSLNIRSSAENLGNTNDLGAFNLALNDIVHVVEVVVNGVATYHKLEKIWRNGNILPFQPSPTGQYWSAEKEGTYIYMTETTNPVPPTADDIWEIYKNGVLQFRITGTTEIF